MMKKLLSILLVAILLLSIMPAAVFAAGENPSDGLEGQEGQVQTFDGNAEGGGDTTPPDDSGDTTPPDDSGDTTPPDDSGDTTPPEDGEEPINPESPEMAGLYESLKTTSLEASFTVVLKGEFAEALSGGEFTLTPDIAGAAPVKSWTTDENGEFIMDYFVNGSYILEQTVAPKNHGLGEVVKWEVEIENGGMIIKVKPFGSTEEPTVATDTPVVYDIFNARQKGKLTLSVAHVFEENGTATLTPDWVNVDEIGSYKITLTIENTVGAVLNGTFGEATFSENVATLNLKAEETLVVENLPVGFTYEAAVVDENAAFKGGVAADTIAVDNTDVTLTNVYGCTTHNEGFNGVWTDAKDPSVKLAGTLTVYSDEACQTKVADITSDASGVLHWDIAEEGTYYVKETAIPDGYHANSDGFTITAKKHNLVRNNATEKRMVITSTLTGTVVEDDVEEAYADRAYSYSNAPIVPVTVSVHAKWSVPEAYTKTPASVSVQLYRDGTAYGDPVTLNADNQWKHSWSGEELTDAYAWTVKQVSVPEGYTESITTQDGYSYTLVNTLQYNLVTISASVTWLNPKGYTKQPASVNITLYRDGAEYETVTVGESNKWTYRWYDMPDCFTWTVDEKVVPTGYKKKITHVRNAWAVVNAHEQIPLTGDDSNVVLWAGVAGAAVVGLGASLYVLLKKRKDDEDRA